VTLGHCTPDQILLRQFIGWGDCEGKSPHLLGVLHHHIFAFHHLDLHVFRHIHAMLAEHSPRV
jgi:hypothetical protein